MAVILLVTPEYPPGVAVGHARTAAFEKFLPEFGFETRVLTTCAYGTLPTDPARRVHRAWDAACLYLPLTRRFLDSSRHHKLPKPGATGSAHSWRILNSSLKQLRDWGMYWLIPDLQITWLTFALVSGFLLLRKNKVDLLYSSSSPETAHLVAGLLACFTHIPWIADFRDGWLFESLKPLLRKKSLRRQVEHKLEAWVVRQASAIVTVSVPITDDFGQRYPTLRHKFHTIPNGYDPDDWRGIRPVFKVSNKFRIVHAGAFTGSGFTRDPIPFFQALANLPISICEHLEVLMVGRLTAAEQQLIVKNGLQSVVQWVGQVSKAESLAYQLSADVLLLLAGTDRSVATSKLYEYLYTARPILALAASDSMAAQVVRETRRGEVVDPQNAAAIQTALVALFERWQKGELKECAAPVSNYHRRFLTGQLAAIGANLLTRSA